MGFIQRELDRIQEALSASPRPNDYDDLYAAQQALAWATDPHGFKSPMSLIRGILEEKADCPACPDPDLS